MTKTAKAFEDFKSKPSVTVVYTGDGKGKTSASLGLMCRGLGAGWQVAYIQFVKSWEVNEHKFINKIQPLFEDELYFYKGGEGFYNAGQLSAKDVSEQEHRQAALQTYKIAFEHSSSGDYDLVICDEINNAVNDGLLEVEKLVQLIKSKHERTSLCLTGRNFSEKLLPLVDIATDMTKLKHHFDNKFLANNGIDF